MRRIIFFLLVLLWNSGVFAQEELIPVERQQSIQQKQMNQQGRMDTLGFQRRNDRKDSITITYRLLDSQRSRYIDSGIHDFGAYYPVPSNFKTLGNVGNAAFPILFEPMMKTGFDAGFHAYDLYRYTPENTRFYKTTRPFTTLGYQIASGKEQYIKAMHTQNPKPNINAGFDFDLISAPGFFTNQNSNHNNYRLYGHYQGKRKRYQAHVVMLGNVIRGSENGGIVNDSFLLNPNYKDRYSIDVNIGNASKFVTNPFSTVVNAGNIYKDFSFFYRHAYDLGKRDSVIINDSTVEQLFYPKLRIEHTFSYIQSRYTFTDVMADSTTYSNWYGVTIDKPIDTFLLSERWRLYQNDLSLVHFPSIKNNAQFLKAGVQYQTIDQTIFNGGNDFFNIQVHAEYRNRTRNKLWNMQFLGSLHIGGLNAGDYSVYGQLDRFLGKKYGFLSLYFHNVNRTASFVFDNRSAFNLGNNSNFSKENNTSFGLTLNHPWLNIGFKNHLLVNYSYFKNYHQTDQYNKLINLLQLSASKKIKITKHWNWYAEILFQQTEKSSPIRVPNFFTNNRIVYEGIFFKNLNLCTGIEARYHTAYYANTYSPAMGQFVPQDSVKLSNLPDIHAFLHFRIRSFTGYVRAENLNTVSFSNGFSFTNNNFAAPYYPTQGLIFRFGIRWWFVN